MVASTDQPHVLPIQVHPCDGLRLIELAALKTVLGEPLGAHSLQLHLTHVWEHTLFVNNTHTTPEW